MIEHTGETVRLFDLLSGEPTLDGATLDGHNFRDCHVNGPCVVVLAENVDIQHSHFDERLDMILIEAAPEAHPFGIVGAIALRNCQFVNCIFRLVGFLGNRATLDHIANSIGGPSPN